MFCFAVKLGKKQIIGLGLSEGNVERLREKKPIWKKFVDFGVNIGKGGVFMYYIPPDTNLKLDPPHKESIVFRMDDKTLNKIQSGDPMFIPFKSKLEEKEIDWVVVIFYGKNEEEMRKDFTAAGLIGPETKSMGSIIDDGQHKLNTFMGQKWT